MASFRKEILGQIERIDKTDISGTKEVDGAKLKVIDEEGNLVERWISVYVPARKMGIWV